MLRLTLIGSLISLILSLVHSFNKYTVKVFLNEYSTEELKEIEITKGEYSIVYLKFDTEEPITEKSLDQLFGMLQPSEPFVLSDPTEIDTFKARFIQIYFGIPCATKLDKTSYQLSFTLKTEETTSSYVTFPNLTVKVSDKKANVKITVAADEIPGKSYGIYTLNEYSNYNVDPFLIKIEKTLDSLADTQFTNLQVPSFDKYRQLMYLYGKYEAPDISEIKDFKEQKGIITIENNQCYDVVEKEIKFRINNKGLAEVGSAIKKEILKRITFQKRGRENEVNDIAMKIEINAYPVLLSCGIQPEIKDDDVLIQKMKNVNDNVKEMNENLFMTQKFVNTEGLQIVFLRDLSRWATGFTVLCTLDNTATVKEEEQTLRIKFGNVASADKIINIVNENPQSSACAVWTFDGQFSDMTKFTDKAIYSCNQHFATINKINSKESLDSNGCIQCDYNKNISGTSTNPQQAICIRNQIRCPTNFDGNLIDEFSAFVAKLDSKAKIEKELSISVTEVMNVDYQNDNSTIETESILSSFVSTTEDELTVSTKNNLPHTITCRIKKLALHESLSIVDDQFFDDSFQQTIKPKESFKYTLPYPTAGFDVKTYNVFFKCYNLDYEGKFTNSGPFISLTVLKTNQKAPVDPIVPKNNCTDNPYHVECIVYVNHEPLNMLNYQIIPPYKQEINDFKRLSYEFQTLMIEDEFKEMESVQQKGTLIDKAIYLGHILGIRNCNKSNDFQKCRAFKTAKIDILISLFKKMYASCDTLVDDIRRTSSGNTSRDIVLFPLALFQLGNNADSYTNDTSQFLFNITNCVIKKAPILREMLFNYSENFDIYEKSIIDFVQLLITHSANVIDVIGYLEMDGILKANENTNIFNNTFVEVLHKDYEQAFTLLLMTDYSTISYDNAHYVYFKREDYIIEDDTINDLKPTGSDPKMVFFVGPNIKITVQPRDLFILSEATYISVFAYDHYPYLSINKTSCSSNAVGLKFYKLNETYDIVEIDVPYIPKTSYPTIQYNYLSQNKSFEQGLYFDMEKKEFIPEYSHLTKVTKDSSEYAKVSIYRSGYFTIGYREATSWLWLIITLAVVGVVLVVVGAYFLFSYIKKSKTTNYNVDTGALIKEDV